MDNHHSVSLIQYPVFKPFAEVTSFTTTRGGGTSSGNYSSLNLGFNSGDEPAKVLQNRVLLAARLALHAERIILPKQTHSDNIKIIDSSFFAFAEVKQRQWLDNCDALVTRMPGICVAVKTADCVPILILDPAEKVVAAVHAGWRGTAAAIVAKTVSLMVSEFGCRPADMVAAIGPAISPEVYEVGAEVWSRFGEEFCRPNGNPEKRLLDLPLANHRQLEQCGLLPHHIELSGYCTFTSEQLFFSARRDGAQTGRMASGIMMAP